MPPGYSDADHPAISHTAAEGVAAAQLDVEQRDMLRALLGTCLDRVPPQVSPQPRYNDDAKLDAVHLA